MADPRFTACKRALLTSRQEEFLLLAITGKSNAEIAEHFGVSADNVKKVLSSAYAKLQVKNRTEAAYVFMQKLQ